MKRNALLVDPTNEEIATVIIATIHSLTGGLDTNSYSFLNRASLIEVSKSQETSDKNYIFHVDIPARYHTEQKKITLSGSEIIDKASKIRDKHSQFFKSHNQNNSDLVSRFIYELNQYSSHFHSSVYEGNYIIIQTKENRDQKIQLRDEIIREKLELSVINRGGFYSFIIVYDEENIKFALHKLEKLNEKKLAQQIKEVSPTKAVSANQRTTSSLFSNPSPQSESEPCQSFSNWPASATKGFVGFDEGEDKPKPALFKN